MSPSAAAQSLPSAPAFRQVYDEQAAFVWRSMRRLGVRDADLEDACQEVFVVVHRKLDEFAGRSAVRTWVFGICLRVAADHRKRAHVRREEPVAAVPDAGAPATQADGLERKQARALLDAILDELDEDQRAAFVLYELEQWPMAEVASALGCPLQTAYSRLHAARRHVEAAATRLGKELAS